jgi:2-haloacid dehalogenase
MSRPALVLFDVNETLSDLNGLRGRFEEVGAPGDHVGLWLASTLRDGFALTATGAYADFRTVGRGVLRAQLAQVEALQRDPDDAAIHILAGLGELHVHPDVAASMRRFAGAEVRMATLSVGPAENAAKLLDRAELGDLVERHFSVDEVGRWKPAPDPYRHAARECGVALERCVLLAVHPWDIHGAKRAGMRAGWVNRGGREYPEFFERADAESNSLSGLAEAFVGEQ